MPNGQVNQPNCSFERYFQKTVDTQSIGKANRYKIPLLLSFYQSENQLATLLVSVASEESFSFAQQKLLFYCTKITMLWEKGNGGTSIIEIGARFLTAVYCMLVGRKACPCFTYAPGRNESLLRVRSPNFGCLRDCQGIETYV